MFENVVVIGAHPLKPVSPADIDAAQAELGARFPAGYREFVTRFGAGVLGGSYIRIYTPDRILRGPNNLAEWRQRVDEYWFWDIGADVLTKARALECMILGDTLDGDELIFHPDDPDIIYVLPRHEERIFVAGNGLAPAIEWLCGSGVLADPFAEREFEPFP